MTFKPKDGPQKEFFDGEYEVKTTSIGVVYSNNNYPIIDWSKIKCEEQQYTLQNIKGDCNEYKI